MVGGCSVNLPVIGKQADDTFTVPAMAKASGIKPSQMRIAEVALQNPTDTSISESLSVQPAIEAGAKVVYDSAQVPAAVQPNYAPYVQAVLATHPNEIFFAVSTPVELPYIQELRAEGYTGGILGNAGIPANLFTNNPAAATILNGVYQSSPFPEPTDNSAASRQEVADLKTAGIYTPGYVDIGVSVGYWSADQFINMLQSLAKTGKAITSANLVQYVNSGKFTYVGLQGAVSPMPWPQSDDYITAECASIVKVDTPAKKLIAAAPMHCYPKFKLTAPASS